MKTTFKVAFVIVALAMFLPLISVRAQDTSYVGATVGTTYTFHESVGTACFAYTMHVDNITYVDTTESYVGVTTQYATILGSSTSHDKIYVKSSAADNTTLASYIVNKNIVNKTFSVVTLGYRTTVEHDSSGILTSWIWAYTNGTELESIKAGAGTGCTGLPGVTGGVPGYEFMIVGAVTLLGVAILAIRMKRKY